MKLLKLSMSNLASLEGEQVINFEEEPLKSADLFSIVGETGSGKSTLLDAICLALYGRTPRFYGAVNFDYYTSEKPKSNRELLPNDPRNILRRGAKTCYAEVIFLANDGCRYRAWWSCGFARTNYTPVSRRLFRIETQSSDGIAETELDITGGETGYGTRKVANKALDEIIGLDYDQFTRTVMLAQNSFANFIRANDKEKALLLEKLTGTEIYTQVARKIYEFYKDAEAAYAAVQQEIGAISNQLLSEDELQNKQQEQNRLNEQWMAACQSLDRTKENCKWYADEALLIRQLEEAMRNYQASCDALSTLEPVRLKVQLYQDLLPVREDFTTWQTLALQLADTRTELAQKNQELSAMQQQAAILTEKENKLQETWEKSKIVFEEKTVVIRKARLLKTELDGLKQVEERSVREVGTADTLYANLQQELQLCDKKMKEQACLIAEKTAVLQQMRPYQSMLDSLPVLLKQLDELFRQQASKKEETEALQTLRNTLREKTLRLETRKQEQVCMEQTLEKTRKELQVTVARCLSVDAVQLQETRNKAAIEYKDMKRLQEIYLEASQLHQEQQTYREQQKQQSVLLEQLTSAIQQARQEREAIRQVLPGMEEAYRLTMGKTADTLRQLLRPGERCPVCGATEHPYASRLSDLLSPLKADIEQKLLRDKELSALLEEPNDGLLVQMNRLTGLQAARQQALESLTQRLAALQTEWAKFSAEYGEEIGNFSVSDFHRNLTLLENRLLSVTEVGKKAADALRQLAEWQAEQRRLQTMADKQQTDLDAVKKSMYQLQGDVQAMEALLEQREKTLGELRKTMVNTTDKLRQSITLPDWEKLFSDDYPSLVTRLTTLQTECQDALLVKQQTEVSLEKLQVSHRELEKQLQLTGQQCTERKKILAETCDKIKKIQEACRTLLGEEDPDELESRLKNELTANEAAYNRARKDSQTHHLQLAALREASSLLQQRTETLQNQHKESEDKLAVFVDAYNQTHIQSNELSFDVIREVLHQASQVAVWQHEIDVAAHQVVSLKGGVEVHRQNLDTHRSMENRPADSLEVLSARMKEQEELCSTLDRERQYVGAVLLAHARNLEKISTFKDRLDTCKKDWADWKELNDLLGNANGDKFRETAQCFTLHFLILQANAQLHLLNKRYSLEQVKDSLGIRVIDHDRADEVRNLSSLSGGETFLISLSLALGLSALSSRNIRMSNLFVDEGFGTLDSNSLNLVIDALSNLQSMQGKKVGVISHTHEMKERIQTQIKVVKSGTGGKSYIEII